MRDGMLASGMASGGAALAQRLSRGVAGVLGYATMP